MPPHHSDLEVALLGGVFFELSSAHSALRKENHQQSPWLIEWLFEQEQGLKPLKGLLSVAAEIHGIALPDPLELHVEEVADRDWLHYSYAQFPPFNVGPFFIYGSHYEGAVEDSAIGLQIDAATAFGSGEHGTTAGCLQAMLWLNEQGVCPWNILDMGTGSGILGIAAWKLWKAPVLAVDNDPESIVVTERHMDANGVPSGKGNMRALVNEGFAGDEVSKRGPYELVIANILAGPLKDMAADLYAVVDENGYVVLSGILNEQAQGVRDVYEPLGLATRREIIIGEWTTLVMQR